MSKHKYSLSEFVNAVSNCYSISAVLRCLGLVPSGGNYKIFYNYIKKNNIDISHFTGQGHLRGKTNHYNKPLPLEQICVENSTYNYSNSLKKRLINNKILTQKCYSCGLVEWLNQPIPLELHHINGINNDHRIENLQLLCPNCHALTSNYRGKNKK